MSRLSLFFLGPPRIEKDGLPVKVDTHKAVALLAYLAVTGESHRRDSLLNLLWPDHDQTRARALLRRNLYALNKALGGGWLDVDREMAHLNPDADIWLDVREFSGHLAQCLLHNHTKDQVCSTCVTPLTKTAELYRGDFLAGFSLKDSLNFDDWQFFQAENLRLELSGALERLVKFHGAEGEFEQALRYARHWLRLDPLHEPAHYHLIRLYALTGQRAAALRQYGECVEALEGKLGISPQEPTVQLYEAIRENRLPTPSVGPHRQPLDGVKAQTPPTPDAPTAIAEGENRNVTVLYLDISSPVDAARDVQAAGAVSLMNRFLKAAEDVLSRYGGGVDRFIGESILAVFGALKTRENDPELAIRAAMEIVREARKSELGVAAGVSSGGVYFTKMGSEEGRKSTMMGKVVNLAMRLAEKAEAGDILVGESTYRHTRRAFKFEPLRVEVKGADEPVTAYRVVRLLARPRKARGIEGLRAELIGRDEELGKLKNALNEVLRGRGQMVSIIGETGVGKSRLVAELEELALNEGKGAPAPLWLEGRCLELGAAASYCPFIDVFREYFAWGPHESDSLRAETIVSSLREMVNRKDLSEERFEKIGPLLGNLLSVQFGNEWDERLKNQSPQQIKNRTFIAVRDFLIALSKRQPLVLVLEDLHWADDLSIDLISLLMEALKSEAIFLLLVYRPEREHKCWHLGTVASRKCPDSYTELNLKELTPDHSLRLVKSLLTLENLPASVSGLILEKSQGNPFFVEEVVRSLIDSGMVYREGDLWQTREGIESVAVSESVQSVILGRVDRLDGKTKSVLQSASVIGRLFRRRVLERVVASLFEGEGQIDLERALWELEDRELIYKERSIPEEDYSFKHVLTQEAVYQSIVQRRRSDLHLAVAEAIEALYNDSLDEYYEGLAYHYDKGNYVPKAIEYLFKAGEKAKRNSANEAAISHFRRGLELLETLPDTPERSQKELDLQIALGPALIATKGYGAPEIERVYIRARELCQQLGETSHLFPVLYRTSVFYFTKSEPHKAREQAEQFLNLAQRAGDPAVLLQAHLVLGATLFYLGEFEPARKHLEEGIALYDPKKHRFNTFIYGQEPGVNCLTYMILVLWFLGYPDQALKMNLEALELAREVSHPFSLAHVQSFIAVLHHLRREEDLTQKRSEEVIALSTEQGFTFWSAIGNIVRGWSVAEGGEVEGGIAQIRKGLASYRATGAEVGAPIWLAMLAEAYGKLGRKEEGLAVLVEAQSAVEKGGERMWEAELYRLRGELLLRVREEENGRMGEREKITHSPTHPLFPSSPEECFRKAIEVARRQGAKSLELRATMSLSRLLKKQGRKEEAMQMLQEIHGWFTEGFDTADLKEAKALLEQSIS
jgi:predicted ATPase/DNA-binding SARP family transcriptional activator/class 3 adenylate cyclase